VENYQEPLTVRDLDLERKMHRIFTPWSENHRKDYSGIGVLPYDPNLYPEQRIDNHIIEARIRSTRIPSSVFIWGMRRKIISTFADKKKGQAFVNTFNSTPGYEDTESPLSEVIANEFLDQGRSVAIITDHADNLTDIARATAGLSVALATKFGDKYMGDFGILVNKNITRETHKGRKIVSKLSDIAEVHTVMPDTASVEKYRKIASQAGEEITEEEVGQISKKVTGGSARVIFRRIKNGKDSKADGLIEGIVPTGQGTIKLLDRHKQVKAHTIPAVTNTAANLLCRFDGAIAVSLIGDEYKISPIIPIKEILEGSNDPFANLVLTENIMDMLAEQTTEVAGLPVHYQRSTPTDVGSLAIRNF
jgi:hypothetical protein